MRTKLATAAAAALGVLVVVPATAATTTPTTPPTTTATPTVAPTEEPSPTETPTPAPRHTVVTTRAYDSTWTATWRGGRLRTDTTDAVQGTLNGVRSVAQVGFPTLVYEDLMHARETNPDTRITRVEVKLRGNHWWYNSGGAADIGVHANAARPTVFKSSGQLVVTPWARGETKWVTLPSTWLPGWNSGNTKGITLGGKAPASLKYYGRVAGTRDTHATWRPQVRVTFTAPPA